MRAFSLPAAIMGGRLKKLPGALPVAESRIFIYNNNDMLVSV
jgi:hypothetical protein